MLRQSSTKANARPIFTPVRGILLCSALKSDVNNNEKLQKLENLTRLLEYYKNDKFRKRIFLSKKFVFMRKITYVNAQGYVCYHRLLF
jgi:hypothetical protein